MNEEEKKALETLKEVASDDFDTLGDDISPKMAQNILNVIDKLKDNLYEEQEQNEYLKDKVEKQEKEIEDLTNFIEGFQELKKQKRVKELICEMSKFQNEFISKDKIRKLIKDKAYKDSYKFKTISIKDLEELLKEN